MDLIIAAAQSASEPGNVPQNVANHVRSATFAGEHGVHLLIFPELSLIGYELQLASATALEPGSPPLAPLREVAARTGMILVAGAPLRGDSGALHIGALGFHPDGSVTTYAKEHVHESEQHVFTSGSGGPLLHVGDALVALAICADASHPSHAAKAAERGANIYAAGVMISEDAYHRKTALMRAYAERHRMAVLMANYAGDSGGEASPGKSAIWSEDGRVIAASKRPEEALVVAARRDGSWTGFVLPVPASPHVERHRSAP